MLYTLELVILYSHQGYDDAAWRGLDTHEAPDSSEAARYQQLVLQPRFCLGMFVLSVFPS
jgi:hypothetical protein